MKRLLLLVVAFVSISVLADAQLWKLKRYELQLGVGPSQFFGDIGGFARTENVLGFRDMTFKQTRLNTSLALKYRITEEVNVKLNLTYGLLRANDQRGSNVSRGYAATTSIFEQSVSAEYYFVRNKAERSYAYMKGRGLLSSLFSTSDVYGFTGIGGVYYNVIPNDKFEPYLENSKGYAPIIPIGLGISTAYSSSVNLGVEFTGHYVFSDNIEGLISQYNRPNDVYYFLNLTFTYKLNNTPGGLPTLFRR